MNKVIKNIPNILTMSRIITCILGASMFISGNILPATILYVYGAISDYFDGLAARKLNAFSEFGRKLDAFSDKIYAGSLLIPSIISGNLLMLIPLLLELKIASITIKSENLGFKPATMRIGKFKTAMLFPTMIIGLLSTISISFYPLLWLLLTISTILQSKSIVAYQNLLDYNIKNKDFIENNNNFVKKEDSKVVEEKKVNSKYYYGNPRELVEELVYYIITPDYNIVYKNEDIKKRQLKL